MNAKRAKSLRRSLRELGHDAKERAYLEGKQGLRSVPSGKIGEDGKPLPPRIVAITGTVILNPKCGRAMYQAAKREVLAS